MERQERIGNNPLRKVVRVDIRGQQKRRRAFTDEEFNRLLAVAGERKIVYQAAAFTGLRVGELQQLIWGDMKLDDPRPHILVRAATAKNRREAIVPLHPQLLAELKVAKPTNVADTQPVFSHLSNADRQIRRDLDAAGIQRIDTMGRKLDFHCLRYTFATKLARSGISMRLAQELMRHSDPRLTANIYTDTSCLPTFEAVSGLEWQSGAPVAIEGGKEPYSHSQLDSQKADFRGQNQAQMVANGTDGEFLLNPPHDGDCAVLAGPGAIENWRRGRDSNPRYLSAHLISSQARSTTLPPLRFAASSEGEGPQT